MYIQHKIEGMVQVENINGKLIKTENNGKQNIIVQGDSPNFEAFLTKTYAAPVKQAPINAMLKSSIRIVSLDKINGNSKIV